MSELPVRVLDNTEWRAWKNLRPAGPQHPADCLEAIREQGWAPVMFTGQSMMWVCPGCGHSAGGTLGDEPVSGWDSPRWVRSGPAESPSLTPSLGCPRWRAGECAGGHYWLRGGMLVPA